jgi:carboxymethylenebutenolidase
VQSEAIRLPGDPQHGDPESPATAVVPPDARRAVVVIHEIFGPQPEIDRVVLRFARAGYGAVAPDLFFRGRLACLRAVFRAMQTGEDVGPVRQALRARRWIADRTGVPESRVGLIGFCFGGGFALLAGRGWGAVSANYGSCPAPDVLRGVAPTIACYGGRDRAMRRDQRKLAQLLPALGSEHELHVFENAGHSFLTDGVHPIASALSWPLMHVRYDAETAEEGWRRILAFFDRHLGAVAGAG